MSDRNRDSERTVMGDPNTIRTWGEEREAVPVYYSSEDRYELMHRDEVTDDHTAHTWDEFSEKFADRDEVLVHGEREGETTGLGSAQFVDRENALARATVDDDDVQERLLEGETVTTEFEEEVVVEKRVREHETIESELVATEEVDRRVVDRDLISRRIVEVDVGHIDVRSELVGDDVAGREGDRTERHTDTASTTDTTHTTDRDDLSHDDHGIEEDTIDVEIEETWRVTEEVLERMTIESRVIEDTITEDETMTSDSTQTSIDVEGVHRSLASQGFLGTDADADDFVGGNAIRSEVLQNDEGEVVRSQLFQRKLIESEVVEHKTLTYDLTETVETGEETTTTTERDTEIVDVTLDEERYAEYDYDLSDETVDRGRAGADTADSTGTTGTADSTGTTGTADSTGTTRTTGTGEFTVDPSDQGRTVVDEAGNEIGMVDEVDEEGNHLYVDPDPSMFDKVKAQLGWGGQDEDDYVITPDQIADRDGNQIVIREA